MQYLCPKMTLQIVNFNTVLYNICVSKTPFLLEKRTQFTMYINVLPQELMIITNNNYVINFHGNKSVSFLLKKGSFYVTLIELTSKIDSLNAQFLPNLQYFWKIVKKSIV